MKMNEWMNERRMMSNWLNSYLGEKGDKMPDELFGDITYKIFTGSFELWIDFFLWINVRLHYRRRTLENKRTLW